MAKHSIVHIEIPTRDPEESGKFYRNLFDWKVDQYEAPVAYTMWQPPVEPGGGFIPVDGSTKAGDVLLYVESEDIEADLKKAVKLGGKVVKSKTEIPTVGWFGIFTDPTGNRIALYTDLKPQA